MQTRYWLKPIFTVAYRNIRITTRYRTWIVASFLWPVIFPLTFFFMGRGLAGTEGQGLSHFESLAQTGDYASFLIVGNLVWMFVNINLWMGGLALQTDRLRGTFDTHWTMPVAKLSIVLGATASSLVLNFIPIIAAILFYSLIGVFQLAGNLADIVLAILLIMPFLIGFLFTFAALTMRVRQAWIVVSIARTLLSILCGMQFPLAVLPESVSRIGRYIPLTHLVDIVRGIIIHEKPLAFYRNSIIYITVSGFVMFGLGVLVFELIKRTIRKQGLAAGY
jgi:ABC-2 type transport system permease protein